MKIDWDACVACSSFRKEYGFPCPFHCTPDEKVALNDKLDALLKAALPGGTPILPMLRDARDLDRN